MVDVFRTAVICFAWFEVAAMLLLGFVFLGITLKTDPEEMTDKTAKNELGLICLGIALISLGSAGYYWLTNGAPGLPR